MGKMSGATNLADTDPLGVQTNIDFSHVGGMETHIQQLKEMVSLPFCIQKSSKDFKLLHHEAYSFMVHLVLVKLY
ncbi:hypothetical protein Pst134EA_007611 [Puccinia striiformis f. sp. tritici]|nr:hypothetical protein Pst134EA_007611 [Puccinia striiformis f. sp. tritici]KAH9470345.1 hypothetical protein Pst134EA_007611 [Puccinia striiformis f. sp. tritici]